MTTEKNPRPSGRGVVKYLSVCSGIEAATVGWHPLGWAPFAFSEIEPFPSAVLAHHYPDTPNLGDMTKFKEWPDAALDVFVGGTPCQSFSVAGLRKGLDDPRGNLMLTYLAIAAKYRPRWLVWENVPGVLSSNGGRDFGTFLDMLESLGYVCDIEILDAQFFGVPQRRRRVFVCAQHRDDLLSQKTDTSALTITQCLQEILLCILSEARSRFASGQGSLDLPSRSKDGAKRRMELFGLAGEADCWPMLLENLVEAFRRLPQEQRRLGVTHGEPVKEPMPGVQSTGSQTESLFTLTEQSLKTALGDALEVMRSFITSTETSSTTQAQIFSCSRAALLIAKLTQRLSQSSPAFWNSALSSLTAVEEFTDYARSTSSDLFGDMERLQSWCDFIEQAEHSNDAFIGFGVECFGEIFPLTDCLQGHPAPRREAGKDVAGGAARSVAIRGRDGIPHAELGDEVANAILTPNGGRGGVGVGVGVGAALVPMPHADISQAIKARDSKGVSSDGDGDGAILVPMVAHSLRAEGFDASEDGSGRGTPLVPVLSNDPAHAVCANEQKTYTNEGSVFQLRNVVAQPVAFSCKDHGADAGEIAPTLRSMSHDGSHANGGGQMAVAAVQNQRNECRITDVIGALQAEPGVKQQAYLAIHPASAFTTKLHNTASNNAGKIFEERTPCLDANSPPPALLTAMQVRRLTPTECERLQGFKDGYTAIQWRGKPADQCPDVPRYKALGNSMAVTVMAWIGRRIAMVDSLANLDLGALVYPEKVA